MTDVGNLHVRGILHLADQYRELSRREGAHRAVATWSLLAEITEGGDLPPAAA